MADLKDAVLARVDLAELVGQYVPLKPAGRELKGCCPFHEEKTPSFHVNAEKGLFHCFGCREGGSAIDFVMRIENLEFRDALEWLARKYNVEIPRYEGGGARRGEKERLYELNEAAQKFFRKSLEEPRGEGARKYLAARGVSGQMTAEFDLGYAPREWEALTTLLIERGARSAELVKLGLAKERRAESAAGPGGGHYDAFRDRLIFPMRSVAGRVIGFAGRALSEEDTPKYLNVTNTPLYDKSKVLYNLDRAKGSIRDEGAVIVEGYMDVIGLAQAGVENVVASCGTALTAGHVTLLKRYTDRFILAFDGDEAGRRATWSAGLL
ncbi:DNA primase, partial [bacterium]|nr:DNA primase [bacterium]